MSNNSNNNLDNTLEMIKDYIIIVGEYAEQDNCDSKIIEGQIMRDEDGILLYYRLMAVLQSREFDYKYELHTNLYNITLSFPDDYKIDLSVNHKIPYYAQIFTKKIFNIKMNCAIENKNMNDDECCDYVKDSITYKEIHNPLIEKEIYSSYRKHNFVIDKNGNEYCDRCGLNKNDVLLECSAQNDNEKETKINIENEDIL